MRLLHVITGLGTGGAELMLYKLLAEMRHSRFSAAVVSLRDRGTVGDMIESLGVPLYVLNLSQLAEVPRAIRELRSIAGRLSPAIVQGWMYHGNVFSMAIAGKTARDRPLVWNIRQSLSSLKDEKRQTALLIRAGAWLSSFPDRIVYNSSTAAAQHVRMGYSAARRVLLPNGFDVRMLAPDALARASVREEFGLPDSTLIVGLVARFHPMKDHVGFLHAAQAVLSQHPHVHFLLVGTDVDPANPLLMEVVSRLNLGHRVHLLGERGDVPRLTAALDIAVSASWRGEAFSNAIGEAMACGVPCVVTDVGDSASIVGTTGLIVRPGDPEQMADAISKLVAAGSEHRTELGRRARQRVVENFSMESVAERYESLYMQILNERMA